MGRACRGAMDIASAAPEQQAHSLDHKCCNGDSCEQQLGHASATLQWPAADGSADDSLPSATAYLLNAPHMAPGAASCAPFAAGMEQLKAALLHSQQQRASSGSGSDQSATGVVPLPREAIAAPAQAAVHLQAARAKRPRPIVTSRKLPNAPPPSLPSLSAGRSMPAGAGRLEAAGVAGGATGDADLGRVQPVTPSCVPRGEPQRLQHLQKLQHHQLQHHGQQPLVPHAQQLLQSSPQQQQQQLQQQSASPSVQKQRTACLAAMLSPTPRGTIPIYCPSAAALLLGVRLCIDSPQATRSGKVVDMQAVPGVPGGKHRVSFDDGSAEWVQLDACKWRWLSPRTPSAGLTPSLRNAMRKLGASNLVHDPNKPMPLPSQGPPIPALGPTPADAAAAVGHRVWLWSPGDVRWHLALVVALSGAGSGRHHVVYMDGSDEWVELNKEVVAWEPHAPHAQRHALGLTLGVAAPTGQAAVGWRLAVYWTQDQTFYEGIVTAYKPSNGQHEVLYDDNERETMRVDDEVVVWRCKAANVPRRGGGHATSSKSPASKRARTAAHSPLDTCVESGLLRRTVSVSVSPSGTSDAAPAVEVAPAGQQGAGPMLGVDKPQACKATAGQVQHGVNLMQQVV